MLFQTFVPDLFWELLGLHCAVCLGMFFYKLWGIPGACVYVMHFNCTQVDCIQKIMWLMLASGYTIYIISYQNRCLMDGRTCDYFLTVSKLVHFTLIKFCIWNALCVCTFWFQSVRGHYLFDINVKDGWVILRWFFVSNSSHLHNIW